MKLPFWLRRRDTRLDAEIQSHLDMAARDRIDRGESPANARISARREFGSSALVADVTRDQWGFRWLADLAQDLRYAARTLRRSPGFTAMAVITLALGIGANTAIFSFVSALFFQPLSVPHASQLVNIYQVRNGRGHASVSYPDYLYFRDHTSEIFSELAAHYPTSPIHLSDASGSQQINGSVVTSNYFALLQLTPARGRFFLPEEDQVPDRNPVAVISYALWQGWFAGNPRIIGESVRLNAANFTIVGVAPEGFRGAMPGVISTEVWIPTAMLHIGYHYCDGLQRDCTILYMLGRLKPGHALADAQTSLAVLAGQLATAYPDVDKGHGVIVLPARGIRANEQADSIGTATLLLIVVGLVLLVACANVAGLLLARGTARQKEIAVRLALGATRGRLTRQLLTESTLLSLLGCGLGLIVAFWAERVLLAYYDSSRNGSANLSIGLNLPVLLFAFGIALNSGILFGLAPARQSSRTDLVFSIKSSATSSGGKFSRSRDVLVVAQVAVSVLLLIGAGLVVRSLQNIHRGAGYDPAHLLWVRLRPSLVNYPAPKAWAFQREVLRRLESLPGVLSASPSDFSPLKQDNNDAVVFLPGHAPDRKDLQFRTGLNQVGPRYFQTLGASLLSGREFDERDQKNSPAVAIVNETLARHFWPRENPVGKSVVLDGHAYEIVGVVGNAQYLSAGTPPIPFAYTNYWQQDTTDNWGEDSRTLVRVSGDPRAMLPLFRREIAAVDSDVPISEDRPFTDWLEIDFQPVRMAGTFLACFGGLALLMSAVGLYGVLAFTVSQRTREIGIRMALGAGSREVATLILRQAGVLAIVGLGIGVCAAAILTHFLSSLLYGVKPYDSVSFFAAPVILGVVSLLACYVPARRAICVDPIIALRYE